MDTRSSRPVEAKTKNLLEFYERFYEFEANHDLFGLTVKGRCFWDYVRYYVSSYCVYSDHSFKFQRTWTWRHYTKEFLRIIFYFLKGMLAKKDRYDIVIINYSRNNAFEGKSVNITTYPIIRELHDKYRILLMDPFSLEKPAEGSYPCDVLRTRPFYILDRLLAYGIRFSREEKTQIEALKRLIRDAFGIGLNHSELLCQNFSFQLRNFHRYTSWFKKYRPKLVMYADDGNCKGLIEAANRLGIPTVDLQHAVVSKLAVLYNYPEPIQKTVLPSVSKYIFTLGDYWNTFYRTSSVRLSVGWPFFEIMKRAVSEKHRGADKRRNVIILSSPFSRGHLMRLALELSELMPDYTIYYKLHLKEYAVPKEQFPAGFLQKGNIRLINSNEIPLYEYFSMCAYQVGVSSTALYEGLGFGLTTFVVKIDWYEEVRTLYENGYALLVSDAEEIVTAIQVGKPSLTPTNLDALFKKDGLRNIEYAIDSIIGDGNRSR